MNDEELVARAREVSAELRRRPGDLDRLAGALLAELAGRLEGRAAEARGIVTPHGIAGLLPADWPAFRRDRGAAAQAAEVRDV